jgi:hypothetical protein
MFAIVTYQTAALSRGGAVLLAVGAILPVCRDGDKPPGSSVGALVSFLLGWFVLGVQAIRRDRPAIDPRPA